MKTKISTYLSPVLLAAGILAAGLFLPTSRLHAATYTLTTKTSDGGFDGWIDLANNSNTSDTSLRVGNVGASYLRSSAILMFNLSSLTTLIDFDKEEIVSVTLSYYVISAYQSANVNVTHGTKTATTLTYGSSNDTPTAVVGGNIWTENLGVASGTGGTTVSFGVTAAFLSDLNAKNAYSSYRLAQADTYGAQIASQPWGSSIASSKNTSGYLVPTLTITTQAIAVPEPAHVGMLLGAGFLMFVLMFKLRQ